MTTGRLITKRNEKWVKIRPDDWHEFLEQMRQNCGGAQEGRGAGNCCDEVCKGHGGCSFGGGTIAVCNDDDVFICDDPEA